MRSQNVDTDFRRTADMLALTVRSQNAGTNGGSQDRRPRRLDQMLETTPTRQDAGAPTALSQDADSRR